LTGEVNIGHASDNDGWAGIKVVLGRMIVIGVGKSVWGVVVFSGVDIFGSVWAWADWWGLEVGHDGGIVSELVVFCSADIE
jgi:hypothetical protein